MNIHIPTPLRTYTDGKESIHVDASTIATALDALVTAHPGLKTNLYGGDGKLRSFVNVYLNEDDIRYLPAKEETAVAGSDELTIIPSIAGGR
jgi:molybdopterin synthase sulfur carrier subunit